MLLFDLFVHPCWYPLVQLSVNYLMYADQAADSSHEDILSAAARIQLGGMLSYGAEGTTFKVGQVLTLMQEASGLRASLKKASLDHHVVQVCLVSTCGSASAA